MEKETTKEAAERMSTRVMEILFKDEKKWQQERSYSEEEVENILIEYVKTNPTKPYRVVSWFTQFKRNNK